MRVKKQWNIKSWDQKNYLVIRGFCYIWPLYNEVPLYMYLIIQWCNKLDVNASETILAWHADASNTKDSSIDS